MVDRFRWETVDGGFVAYPAGKGAPGVRVVLGYDQVRPRGVSDWTWLVVHRFGRRGGYCSDRRHGESLIAEALEHFTTSSRP